jgi:hypothetical protein
MKLEFTCVAVVSNEEIFGLDVFGSFGTGDVTVLCKGKSAHIVLKDNIGGNSIPLSFHEVARP